MTRGAAADEELPQRITDDLPATITVRLVSRNGETTAIGTLDTTTGEVSFDSEAWFSDQRSECGAAFTLDGMKLSGKPSKPGLYIYNGKKIIVK